MNKFKLHDYVRTGTISLSVAIKMLVHPNQDASGYAALPALDLIDAPEEFGGGTPLRLRPGVVGPRGTLSNGTSTFVQGTSTYYAWPVP
jgi:hypothetical protein